MKRYELANDLREFENIYGADKVTEVIPNDSHKSFWGRAYKMDIRGWRLLFSYGNLVCAIDPSGKAYDVWGGWSATTGRHIRAFAGVNKSEFARLPKLNDLWVLTLIRNSAAA